MLSNQMVYVFTPVFPWRSRLRVPRYPPWQRWRGPSADALQCVDATNIGCFASAGATDLCRCGQDSWWHLAILGIDRTIEPHKKKGHKWTNYSQCQHFGRFVQFWDMSNLNHPKNMSPRTCPRTVRVSFKPCAKHDNISILMQGKKNSANANVNAVNGVNARYNEPRRPSIGGRNSDTIHQPWHPGHDRAVVRMQKIMKEEKGILDPLGPEVWIFTKGCWTRGKPSG